MTTPDPDSADGKLTTEQLAAVGAAATGLIGGIGALTLTGALGRVQRNHGPWFAVAVGLVLIGAAIFVGAAMIKESAGKLRIRARLPRRRVWVIGVALVVIGLVPLGVAKLPDLWHAIWHPRQHWIIIGAILAAVGTAFLVASTVRLG